MHPRLPGKRCTIPSPERILRAILGKLKPSCRCLTISAVSTCFRGRAIAVSRFHFPRSACGVPKLCPRVAFFAFLSLLA
jgi:hypothetical protein